MITATNIRPKLYFLHASARDFGSMFEFVDDDKYVDWGDVKELVQLGYLAPDGEGYSFTENAMLDLDMLKALERYGELRIYFKARNTGDTATLEELRKKHDPR